MDELFRGVGIVPTQLLLPRADVSPTGWAVVACDQYTSQPEYWEQAALQAGAGPSTLRLTLPECYLSESAARIPQIHQAMRDYLDGGAVQTAVEHGFILTERSTGSGARVGLMCAVDLEQYDFDPAKKTVVRATEATVVERLPARKAVRRGACLETSHVLMLMDDPMMSVVEPLYEQRGDLPVLYDFPLMMDGGHLKGWKVEGEKWEKQLSAALHVLKDRQGADPILFAVGDGNHSLATAKGCWEELKPTLTPAQQESHPARYALVEIENIHDDALTFEPIHRLLTGMNGDALMHDWTYYCDRHGMDLSEVTQEGDDEQVMRVLYGGNEAVAAISKPDGTLPVDTLQRYLDQLLAATPGLALDYIHGEEALRTLCGTAADKVGFLLPALDKSALFPAIRQGGLLPRKTFSMGEAHEKRFYMECRRI